MKKPVEIVNGWKAVPVKGGGVIIQAEMSLIAVDWANLDADGELVNRYETGIQTLPEKSVVPVTGPVAIEEFLEATNMRDLGTDGIYGPLGPTVKKFREVLKTVGVGTTLADSAGEFLVTGDHLRHGAVASLVGLKPEQVTVLNSTIDGGDSVALENLLDKFAVGCATDDKAAMDESKSVAKVS